MSAVDPCSRLKWKCREIVFALDNYNKFDIDPPALVSEYTLPQHTSMDQSVVVRSRGDSLTSPRDYIRLTLHRYLKYAGEVCSIAKDTRDPESTQSTQHPWLAICLKAFRALRATYVLLETSGLPGFSILDETDYVRLLRDTHVIFTIHVARIWQECVIKDGALYFSCSRVLAYESVNV